MIDNFFSVNGLVFCALAALIIIGTSYIYKNKGKKLDILNKTYMYLFIDTTLLVIMEFVLYFALLNPDIDELLATILLKIYIFIGLVWNCLVISYILLLIRRKKETNTVEKKDSKIIYTVFFILTIVALIVTLIFDVDYIAEGGYNAIIGPLNTIYNRAAIVGNVLLIIIITFSRKKLGNTFLVLTYITFGVYLINFICESKFGYDVSDSVFVYSLLLYSLYYTTENQDKTIMDTLNASKEEAQRLDDLKTKFVLNISHEIRTPLNTILGYSELLLLEDKIEKETLKANGTEIYQASTDLLELINNILDVSRIESGNEKANYDEYKLETLIFEVNSKISPRVAKIGNTSFRLNIDENLPSTYYGDIQKVQRIVLSLLYNAIEYTSFGEIVLDISGTTVDNETELQFLISNTGHAMKEEFFNVTFDDVASIDATKAINSNVLGIIISKSLAKILGGEIIFKNEVNQGTKYYFKIKQRNITNDTLGNIYEKIENLKGEKTIDCTGKRALIVDDNLVNLKIAKKLLDRFNFESEIVDNGQAAIDKVKDNKYDIIFLDHMMPIMDGVQTLNNLKATYPELPPIIALTANLSDDCRNEYMTLGFDDYLSKPIDFKEMNKVIKKFLENK